MQATIGQMIGDRDGCWMASGDLSESAAWDQLVRDGRQGSRETVELRQVKASAYSRINPGGMVWKAFRLA